MNDTIKKRQGVQKAELIEQLKKTPIVEFACKKSGVGRATFYRWKNEDKEFAQTSEEAITDGTRLISDMAESQLIAAIKDRNMTAIIFYLKAHHAAYRTRVELSTIDRPKEELTDEQQKIVKQALILGQLTEIQNSQADEPS